MRAATDRQGKFARNCGSDQVSECGSRNRSAFFAGIDISSDVGIDMKMARQYCEVWKLLRTLVPELWSLPA